MIAKNYIFGRTYKSNLLLDDFPANLSFSLFKLSKNYTGNCIRVVRSSDFSTLDIGFVNNILDTATLLAFIGSNSGYVSRWFNQSGSNNAFQDTLGSMPRIVNSGTLETLNGHPTLYFDGINDFFQITNETVTINFSVFAYGKRNASGSVFAPLSGSNSVALLHFSDKKYYFQVPTGYLASNSIDTTTSAYLLDAHSSTPTKELYKNQVLVPANFNSVSLNNFFNQIGTYSGANFMTGKLSEVILYKTNQSSNRITIGNNIILRNT